MNRAGRLFIFSSLWLIATIILLTLPGSAFPHTNWLDKIWADKWVHIFLFFTLVTLWCMAFFWLNPQNNNLQMIFVFISLAAVAYGIGMEYVQKYFIPNRSFDKVDIIADAIGSAGGLIYCLLRYIKK